VNGCIS